MSLSAAIEASRRFNLLGADVEPLVGTSFSIVNTGGFSESGTTLLDLAGQPATTKVLKLYIGGRASGRLALGNGIVVMPEAHVRITYDVLAEPLTVTTAFVNGASSTQTTISGLQPGRLAVRLGAGVGVEVARRWRVAVAYQAAIGGGSDLAHELSGSIRGTW
jgi:outer membrane autotransporter protein